MALLFGFLEWLFKRKNYLGAYGQYTTSLETFQHFSLRVF